MRVCCVPGCRSRSPQAVMHSFPKKKELYTSWMNKINDLDLMNESQETVLKNRTICNIHFDRESYFPRIKRYLLKRNAVPSLFLPDGLVKKISQGKYILIDDDDEVVQRQNSSGVDVSKKDEEHTDEPPDKHSRLEDVAYSSVISPETSHEDQHGRFIPRILRRKTLQKKVGDVKKRTSNNSITQNLNDPRFRSIGVQTETENDLNKLGIEENLQQVSLDKSINFLQENLAGHIVRIKGQAFRIDEFLIHLTKFNRDSKDKETITVRSDEVLASCNDLSNHFLENERFHPSPYAQRKMKDFKEKQNIFELSKSLRVVLPRLPEFIVEGAKKGHTVKVTRKESTDSVEEISEETAMEISENSELDPLKFLEKNAPVIVSNEHELKEADSARHTKPQQRPEIPKTPKGEKCPECPVVFEYMQELDDHLFNHHSIVLQKNEYKCELCPKKFITYKSLQYHNTTAHSIPAVDVIIKAKCGTCNDFIEVRQRSTHGCFNKKENDETPTNKNTLVDIVMRNLSEPIVSNELKLPKSLHDGPNEITIEYLDDKGDI